MKFCSHCGKEVRDDAVVCVHCGCALEEKKKTDNADAYSAGLALLGFFFPLIGFILFCVFRFSNEPRKADSAGKGALIGFITGIVLSILALILYVVFVGSIVRLF